LKFYTEDGGSRFLRKAGVSIKLHRVMDTVMLIFTDIKNENLTTE
jgi:hypothetical protein